MAQDVLAIVISQGAPHFIGQHVLVQLQGTSVLVDTCEQLFPSSLVLAPALWTFAAESPESTVASRQGIGCRLILFAVTSPNAAVGFVEEHLQAVQRLQTKPHHLYRHVLTEH